MINNSLYHITQDLVPTETFISFEGSKRFMDAINTAMASAQTESNKYGLRDICAVNEFITISEDSYTKFQFINDLQFKTFVNDYENSVEFTIWVDVTYPSLKASFKNNESPFIFKFNIKRDDILFISYKKDEQ